MTTVAEVRDRLAQEDPRFQRLAQKHQEYDDRLAEFRTRRFLSEEEQLEEIELKKRKLFVKDQMEAMIRQATG